MRFPPPDTRATVHSTKRQKNAPIGKPEQKTKTPPTFKSRSPEAQALVKELQNYITENYYTCTNEILAGLGQMYGADERFKTNIDKHSPGTAEFISQAIKIYCN